MPTHVIIAERKAGSRIPEAPERTVMTPEEYIAARAATSGRKAPGPQRVINLCADYDYLSIGYYCSLLAEARGQRVMPTVGVLLDLQWKRLHRTVFPEINDVLARTKTPPAERKARTVTIFFGRPDDSAFRDAARKAFDLFRCPLLSLELRWTGRWEVAGIKPLALKELSEDQTAAFCDALDRHTRAAWRAPRSNAPARYTIAVLHDPAERLAPSDPRALKKLVDVGARLRVDVELITRKDYARLGEYDALFIRETTAIDHHTFRFARKAEAEGMPVIDDPVSIMRCTNKVYLEELLRGHKVATPHTVIFERSRLKRVAGEIAYPAVLKIPDGSFSRGVHKAADASAFIARARKMFEDSDIILAQEFVETAFDWRIGVLNGEALYACQYFMAKDHWQIYKHGGAGRYEEGRFRTVPVDEVPGPVVRAAVKAAGLIGDGLYGVDVKETTAGKALVIEVNDNPNIDSGVEDAYLRDDLYRRLIKDFIRRIEAR